MPARSSSCGSNPADVCPRPERPRPRGAVLAGGDVVAAEVEEVVDLVVGGEETLRLAGRLEALHLSLSPARPRPRAPAARPPPDLGVVLPDPALELRGQRRIAGGDAVVRRALGDGE